MLTKTMSVTAGQPSSAQLPSPGCPNRVRIGLRPRTARSVGTRSREFAISLRLPAVMLAIFLAVFVVPSSSAEDGGSERRASRGSDSQRFSFGFLAGTGMASTLPRIGSQHSLATLNVGASDTYPQRTRHGSVSPLLGAFAEMRLRRGFSVQASLLASLLTFTTTSQGVFSETPFLVSTYRLRVPDMGLI